MTTQEIIQNFELYVDDTTELSSAEELDLANKIYHFICDDRDWEFLKKEATGSISGTEINLPDDFSHLIENTNYTDSEMPILVNAKPVFVFIGDNKYQVVNWSDRRQYINSNVCYLDIRNNKLIFTTSQNGTYSFDYKAIPDDLTLTTSPVFPARFHEMIYHGMAVDDQIIQMFPKAQSYMAENQIKYNSYLASLRMWNANLQMN